VVKKGDKTIEDLINTPKAQSFLNRPILSIYEDDKNRIWVGTWEGSVGFFDETKPQFVVFEPLPNKPNQLANRNIFGILQSSQTKELLLISGGDRGGLHILKNETEQTFENYTHSPEDKTSISSIWCKKIYEDSKKNIWIGALGLSRFDLNSKKFTNYLHDDKDEKSIINNITNAIFEDSKGRLWVGTSGGLSMMLGDKFVNYTKADGLPSNSIYGILEDSQGNLWLSTGEGISKFDVEKKTFRNYDESDGLQSKQFKYGSYCKAKDGALFFGGVNGLNIFYPDSIKDNTHTPSVLITGLKLFNKPVAVGAYDSLLKMDISQTEKIVFNHEQSVFTLDFVALNLTHSNKNQYAYKLEGFEKEWNYVGSQRSANYTSLPAGTYTFRVKACNNDGKWNEEDTRLIIEILPPFWETWWFRLIVATIFLASGMVFYKVRMYQIKQLNKKLEQKVEEQTHEIRIALEEVQTMNEELHQSQEEIVAQRDSLEVKNHLLETYTSKINSSIKAAKMIQKAILPPKTKMKKLFEEYFVLFKPKDIVSGDFWWANQIDGKKYLIVADCTGHGVSGAMLTMIGSLSLDRIIRYLGITEPAAILTKLHEEVKTVLQQDETHNNEGMDIAIIHWHYENENCVLSFAAAKRPLFFAHNGTIEKVAGSRRNIGGTIDSAKVFETKTFTFRKGTCLYLCSDGYGDQNDAQRNNFSERRLISLLQEIQNLPMEQQKEVLQAQLHAHMEGTEQRDDILVIGVRV
jgi:serine phosphatase RsbU (regulator of sigma subunit)